MLLKIIKNINLKFLPQNKIKSIIELLYIEKKKDLKQFLKDSLKEIQKNEYMGDLAVNTLCIEIFNDDELNKNRLSNEIHKYQTDNNLYK